MKEFSLDEYLKNPDREVVTRDGRKVRIICTDRKSYMDFPVVALVMENEGNEYTESYRKNGSWSWSGLQNKMDLFFAPIKKEGWINIYRITDDDLNGMAAIHNTEQEAKDNILKLDSLCYITTIKVEWEE